MIYPWLEAVDAEFSERLRNDRLPHALLLSGPRETGKVAIVTPIRNMSLIVTVIIAVLFLGEKITIMKMLGVALGAIALVLLSI